MDSDEATWNLDPVHSTAEFKVKHMMITNVKGRFSAVTGTIALDNTDITKSRVQASIDADSITTHNADRDAHPAHHRADERDPDDEAVPERRVAPERREVQPVQHGAHVAPEVELPVVAPVGRAVGHGEAARQGG